MAGILDLTGAAPGGGLLGGLNDNAMLGYLAGALQGGNLGQSIGRGLEGWISCTRNSAAAPHRRPRCCRPARRRRSTSCGNGVRAGRCPAHRWSVAASDASSCRAFRPPLEGEA
jgi:hypothetical protein